MEPHHWAESESDGGVVSEALGELPHRDGAWLLAGAHSDRTGSQASPTPGLWPSPHYLRLSGLPLTAKRHQGSWWDQEQNMLVVGTEKLATGRDSHASSCTALPTGLGDTTAAVAGSVTEAAAFAACRAVCAHTTPFQCLEGQRSSCC